MLIRDWLLPELEQEIKITRSLVASAPDPKLDWRPHQKSFSLRELTSHLVNIPAWVPMTLDTPVLDFAAQSEWKTPQANSTEEALGILDANASATFSKLSVATDEAFLEPWTMKNGTQVFFTIPKLAVIKEYVIKHSVHHRGQLSVYLRLLDVPLPQVYGPTADQAMMSPPN
ncbi:MAG: DinB family protein [Holophagaceae bacterium]|nr:DinB family protein [Holophagaceae bacterium]